MNKTQIILSTTSAAFLALGACYYIGTREATLALHPELDRKIAKKAHAKMLRRALSSKYSGLEMTDAACDSIFMAIVQEITNAK